MRRTLLSGAVILLMLTVQAAHGQIAPFTPLPPFEIVIEAPGIMPEGVDWDEAGSRFLITSLTDGAIRSIDDAGSVEIFAQDQDITTSVGLEVDELHNRLLVAVADRNVFSGGAGRAALAAYDLITHERLFLTELGGVFPYEQHFANDVAVDDAGSAYVTDSTAPVIYRVDMDGSAEVFLQDDRLIADGIGLNGIGYHPDGFLLVAFANSLLKVPLDDPAAFSEVATDDPVHFDGIFLHEGAWLVGVNNTDGQQTLVAMSSADDWATATTEGRVLSMGDATSITQRGDTSYYINAYLGNPSAEEYEIISVNFSCLCE